MPYSGTPKERKAKAHANYLRNRDKLLPAQKTRDAARKATMTPEELDAFKARQLEAVRRYESKHHAKRMARKKDPRVQRQLAIAQRARRAKDPDRFRALAHAAYHANPEKARERSTRWVKNHLEQVYASNQRRRATRRGVMLSDLTAAQWQEIQEAQNHQCAYCGIRCKGKMTKDHITPVGPEGPHTLHNIIGACRSCNSSKKRKANPVPVQPLLLTIAPKHKPRKKVS